MRRQPSGRARRSGRRTSPPPEATCTWDTTDHTVTYSWQAADTDTAGDYDGEVEVTVATGKFTAPANQPKVRITVGGEIS